jgi:hypothetical protein
MALNFTEAQLREMTGRLINADDAIKAQNEQGNKAAKNKQDYKDLDDQEKVYFDNWLSIVEHFQEELKLLNGSQRTLYPVSAVDPSAKLSPGNPHFTNWAGYKPKALDSNNGNPIVTYTGKYESERITRLLEWIGYIINGFTGPAVSGTGTNYVAGSFQVDGAATLPTGIPILLYQANAAVWGICTGSASTTIPANPPSVPVAITTTAVTLTVLETLGTLSGSFSYTFSRSGFNNATRLSSSNDGFLLLCKQILLSASNDLLAVLTSELTHINANDSKSDASTITAAKNATTSFKTSVQNWVNLVGETRYGDSNILPYQTLLTNRKNTYIPARVAEIIASLGVVTQTPDGNFTGNGRYNDLFNSLVFRIHKITGHLRNYYHQDLAVVAAQEQAGVRTAELTRDKDFALVKVLTQEPDNTNKIVVKDLTKLAVGDAVKVMDNVRTGILDYTIAEIVQPNTLVLSDVVPATYTVANQARLVKLL